MAEVKLFQFLNALRSGAAEAMVATERAIRLV